MTDREEHRRRRRVLAPVFAPSELVRMEGCVVRHVRRLVSRVREKSETGRAVDVLRAFRVMSLDVVSELFLGKSFDGLEKVDQEGEIMVPGFLHDMEGFFIVANLEYHFKWVLKAAKLLPWRKWQHFLGSGRRVNQVGWDAVAARLACDEAGEERKKKDLLNGMLEAAKNGGSEEGSMTELEIGCEMSNMLLAGTGE